MAARMIQYMQTVNGFMNTVNSKNHHHIYSTADCNKGLLNTAAPQNAVVNVCTTHLKKTLHSVHRLYLFVLYEF